MLLSEWAYCFNLVVYVYWSRQLFYHINARKVLKYYCIIYKRFHIDKTDLELAGNHISDGHLYICRFSRLCSLCFRNISLFYTLIYSAD